jgi:hypothetical protein
MARSRGVVIARAVLTASLEQIVTNLLNHQSHQLDAIKAALT